MVVASAMLGALALSCLTVVLAGCCNHRPCLWDVWLVAMTNEFKCMQDGSLLCWGLQPSGHHGVLFYRFNCMVRRLACPTRAAVAVLLFSTVRCGVVYGVRWWLRVCSLVS